MYNCPRNDGGRTCNRTLKFKVDSTTNGVDLLIATCKKHGKVGWTYGKNGKPTQSLRPYSDDEHRRIFG